jgi:hypothetical protein
LNNLIIKLEPPIVLKLDDEDSVQIRYLKVGKYPSGLLAVAVIFEDGASDTISLNIPERDNLLDENEFFLRDLLSDDGLINLLVENRIITITDKTAYIGIETSKVAKLNI